MSVPNKLINSIDFSLFNFNHNPKSDAVAPVAWSEPEASGRTADGRPVAPVAAAKKMEAGALCVFRVHLPTFTVITGLLQK